MMNASQNHLTQQQSTAAQQQPVYNQHFQSQQQNQSNFSNHFVANPQQSPTVISNKNYSPQDATGFIQMSPQQGFVNQQQSPVFGSDSQQMNRQQGIYNTSQVNMSQNSDYQSPPNNLSYQMQQQQVDWSMQQGSVDQIRNMDFSNQSIMSINDASSLIKSPVVSPHNSQVQTSQNHMVQNILANPHHGVQNTEAQKIPPRNNEFLQQPQHRPSPAQASTAPDSSHIVNQNKFGHKTNSTSATAHQPMQQSKPGLMTSHSTSSSTANAVQSMPKTNMLEALKNSSTLIQSEEMPQPSAQPATSANNSTPQQAQKPNQPPNAASTQQNSNNSAMVSIAEVPKLTLKFPVLKLEKLAQADQSLMQSDIKSFIKKEPEKAAKLGVVAPNNDVLFSKMKEDENRLPYKRKLSMSNLRPEEVGKSKKKVIKIKYILKKK